MKYWIISGIDGSGKTSVINSVIKELDNKDIKSAYIWLRFSHYSVKLLHALARLSGLAVKEKTEMGVVWQHRFFRSRLFCKVYIYSTFIDTIISKVKLFIAGRNNPDVIICDRWITDIIADLAVKCHDTAFLDSKWAKRLLNLAPKDALFFVIDRKREDVLSCRLENRVDPDFELRYSVYQEMLKKSFVFKIDNNNTISCSVGQIFYYAGMK